MTTASAGPAPTRRFKGTRWNPRGYWTARINAWGRTRYLGSFDTEEAAARAYDQAARFHFGTRVSTNFPLEDDHGSTR